jgi:hypothetical protein
MSVLLAHEAYRNGIDDGAEGQKIETGKAALGHMGVAAQLGAIYGYDTLSGDVAAEAKAYQAAIKSGDWSVVAGMVGNYDSDKDYWRFADKKLIDDGDTAVRDASGKVIYDDGTKEGGLAFSLGVSLESAKALIESKGDSATPYSISTEQKMKLVDSGVNIGGPIVVMNYSLGSISTYHQGVLFGEAVGGDIDSMFGHDIDIDTVFALHSKDSAVELQEYSGQGVWGDRISVAAQGAGVIEGDIILNAIQDSRQARIAEANRPEYQKIAGRVGDIADIISLGMNAASIGVYATGVGSPAGPWLQGGAAFLDGVSLAANLVEGDWFGAGYSAFQVGMDFIPVIDDAFSISGKLLEYNSGAGRWINSSTGRFVKTAYALSEQQSGAIAGTMISAGGFAWGYLPSVTTKWENYWRNQQGQYNYSNGSRR